MPPNDTSPVLLDVGDDEQFLAALGAYADDLYTALGNLAVLLRLRAGEGKGPDTVELHVRTLGLKDVLLFTMRRVAPDIEARLLGREETTDTRDFVAGPIIPGSVVDMEAYRHWRALGQMILTDPKASRPVELAGRRTEGGDAG